MSQQLCFDFDSITKETKFVYDTIQYDRVLASVVAKKDIWDKDNLDWRPDRTDRISYSISLGLLDRETHASHRMSLLKQLRNKYNKYDDQEIRRVFRVPNDYEVCGDVKISILNESIREIIIEND